jgi:hypothetical protein
MVFITGNLVIATRANGNSVSNTARAQTYLQTETTTQENTGKENQKEKDNTHGGTDKYTLESLKMDWNMAKEGGKAQKVLSATHMKEIILMIRNVVMVCFNGQVETAIKESIRMMSVMDLEKWCGQMAVCIQDSGKEEFNTGQAKWYSQMEISKKGILKITSTRDNSNNKRSWSHLPTIIY